MAFFDELQEKILKAGDAAAQKTKELTEVSRLRATISQEQKAIQTAYSQLGQLYYTRFASNPDPDMANVCQRITEANTKIAQCEEQIKELKSEVECSVCHARLPKGTTFCNQCGARLEYDGTAASAGTQEAVFCPSCGKKNPIGTKFCRECGTRMDEPVTSPAGQGVIG